jgi:hypothetical protein
MAEKKTRIALWQQDIGGDKSKPILKGTIELPDGTKQKVSLWVNKGGKENAPTYTGEVDG